MVAGIDSAVCVKVAMERTGNGEVPDGYANGEDVKAKDETRLRELRELFGKAEGDPLRVVGVGAGAWGSVFIAMLQDTYGGFRDSIHVSRMGPPA